MKFGADIFIQSRVIDIFRKLKMVAASGGASYGAKGLKPPQILLKPPQIFV